MGLGFISRAHTVLRLPLPCLPDHSALTPSSGANDVIRPWWLPPALCPVSLSLSLLSSRWDPVRARTPVPTEANSGRGVGSPGPGLDHVPIHKPITVAPRGGGGGRGEMLNTDWPAWVRAHHQSPRRGVSAPHYRRHALAGGVSAPVREEREEGRLARKQPLSPSSDDFPKDAVCKCPSC